MLSEKTKVEEIILNEALTLTESGTVHSVFYTRQASDIMLSSWCPQHGYPEPCVKCKGWTKEQLEEFFRSFQKAINEGGEILKSRYANKILLMQEL